MKKSAVAKQYAKALIEIGKEENRYKEIGNELRETSAIFTSHPELKKFLLNPMYRIEDRQRVLEGVATTLNIATTVQKLLSLLVEKRDIGTLADISSAYAKMEDELSGRLKVYLESPAELNKKYVHAITKRLHEATKKEIILAVEKNPALIGGLILRIGNTVFDGSIKSQLERVKEKILQGVI